MNFRSIGASQLSLEGVTEDESVTDRDEKARQRLRQRAEIALGRKDEYDSDHTRSDQSSRYRYDDRNGHAGGRYEDRNGHAGGRYADRNGHAGGRMRGRSYQDDYSDDERSRKSSTHSSHHNGGYKYSDESNEHHSDHDTDVEEKRKYFDDQDREEEEANTRNSFTPVKFNKPRVEKELDSIRIKEMNRGAVDYKKRPDYTPSIDPSEDEDNTRNSFTPVKFNKPRLEKQLDSIRVKEVTRDDIDFIRRQNDTPSVDFSDTGRNYSRSLSSFSQPGDSESNAPATRPQVAKRYMQNDDETAPTPPAPLPMNIPAKFRGGSDSDRPSPRPVPAPRPPRSNTPSSRNTENVGSQDRLNNLSQDESTRGSRDRLDKVDIPRERFSYKRATEDVPDLNIRSNLDYLPKHETSDLESGRDSPLHQSRENLLPKQTDNVPQYTYQDDYPPPPPMNVKPDMYRQDMYEPNVNSSKEKLYPPRDNDLNNDYSGRGISHQRDLSDSAGVDYLPRQTHTPVDKKFGAPYNQGPQKGYQPSASPGFNAGYRPSHSSTSDYSPSPSPGYGNKPSGKFHPSQFSGFNNHGNNYPAETNIDSDYSAGEAGIDYLPKAGNRYRNPAYPSAQSPSAARDNISRSRENLSRSREDISRSRENLSRSRENLSRSRENLSRSKENLSREILENSMDFNKPKQSKSIETEI